MINKSTYITFWQNCFCETKFKLLQGPQISGQERLDVTRSKQPTSRVLHKQEQAFKLLDTARTEAWPPDVRKEWLNGMECLEVFEDCIIEERGQSNAM